MPILQWLTREESLKSSGQAPYRLIEPDDEYSYGDMSTGNMLIQGDNLDALKALLPYYAGSIKCIYIDPPYNTKSAFEHYDDNTEHSKWLSTIYPRIEILRELLADNGSLWVSIDDHEAHYLKIIMDEIFGRNNFVSSIVWQQRTTRENRKTFSSNHEYILLYAKSYKKFAESRNDLELTDDVKVRYKNPDNDPRGAWQSISANAQAGHGTSEQFYDLVAPSGKVHKLPAGRCWLYTSKKMQEEISKNNIWFGKNGQGVPRIKKFLNDIKKGLTPHTLWLANEVGTNDDAKKHTISIFEHTSFEGLFETPKPEQLLSRIIQISTKDSHDIVLDSFLGSGTTAAVAQKMNRRFIGIEIGHHALTHCVPRLRKVVDGEQGGISKAVNWAGGGGYRFFRLGEPIFSESGSIREGITFSQLGTHVWFSETKTPLPKIPDSPLLGIHKGTAYYLLFNGILKDKSVGGGNVLTSKILDGLPRYDGPKVIYGERCLFSPSRLKECQITFKHTPYDIKGR